MRNTCCSVILCWVTQIFKTKCSQCHVAEKVRERLLSICITQARKQASELADRLWNSCDAKTDCIWFPFGRVAATSRFA